MQIKYFLFIIISSLLLGQSDSTGAVKGRILDADSQLPLVGANITLNQLESDQSLMSKAILILTRFQWVTTL